MTLRSCGFIALIGMAVACVPQVRVYRPFKDVNTILVDARATNMMVSSAKAILVAYRRSVEGPDGTTEPKSPKLIVVDFDDLRNVRFVDQGVRTWNYAEGAVHSRESILIYKPGYEPTWLERRLFGKEYRYPAKIVLAPCDPVRGRKLVFDAVTQAFRGETESCRRAALQKLAGYIK